MIKNAFYKMIWINSFKLFYHDSLKSAINLIKY